MKNYFTFFERERESDDGVVREIAVRCGMVDILQHDVASLGFRMA